MDEFLKNTLTTITSQGLFVNNRVEYGGGAPNILMVYLDETGDETTGYGFAVYRDDLMEVLVNDNGELIIRSFADDEANQYSLDANGNLIYTA